MLIDGRLKGVGVGAPGWRRGQHDRVDWQEPTLILLDWIWERNRLKDSSKSE